MRSHFNIFLILSTISVLILLTSCDSTESSRHDTVIQGSNKDDRDQMHGKGSTHDDSTNLTRTNKSENFNSSDTLYNDRSNMTPVK